MKIFLAIVAVLALGTAFTLPIKKEVETNKGWNPCSNCLYVHSTF